MQVSTTLSDLCVCVYVCVCVCVNISQLYCFQFKHCCPSPDRTIKWHPILHFDSSYANKAQWCNADKHKLQQSFQISGGCVLFFFFFYPFPPLRAGASWGSSRDKFIFSFHAQREVNSVFLAYCDCQANSKSLFSTLCWGAFGDIWDGLTTSQAVFALISMLENEVSQGTVTSRIYRI